MFINDACLNFNFEFKSYEYIQSLHNYGESSENETVNAP